MATCCIVGSRTSLLLLIPLYLFNFLSFHTLNDENLSSKISQQPCKLECSNWVCRLMAYSCIGKLRTSLLLLIPFCICPVYFHSIILKMNLLVKDFSTTMQARMLIFGMQLDGDLLYLRFRTSLFLLFFLVFVHFFPSIL